MAFSYSHSPSVHTMPHLIVSMPIFELRTLCFLNAAILSLIYIRLYHSLSENQCFLRMTTLLFTSRKLASQNPISPHIDSVRSQILAALPIPTSVSTLPPHDYLPRCLLLDDPTQKGRSLYNVQNLYLWWVHPAVASSSNEPAS